MPEPFSVYGFRLQIPEDWRPEFKSKSRRERGDIVFHTSKNNLFFVSWGDLGSALKRFHTLAEHREKSVGRIKGNPNVAKVDFEKDAPLSIGGHEALLSRMFIRGRRGFMGGNVSDKEVLSLHLHCEPSERYYVLYIEVKDSAEYKDPRETFLEIAGSLSCHSSSTAELQKESVSL